MEPLTVNECKRLLASATPRQLPRMIERFSADERAGVQQAVSSAAARLEKHRRERRRLSALGKLERELRAAGYTCVAGADEVGRGALAGPLTVAAVILPADARIEGIDDSKKLSPAAREALAAEIRSVAVSIAVAHAPADQIDRAGISAATREAIARALTELEPGADHVIVDGLGVGGLPVPETAVVAGDSKCAAVAAASIVAKVTRDRLMVELEQTFPGYGFAVNKGYGTTDHMQAIARLGLCDVHRRSFSPCGGTMPLF